MLELVRLHFLVLVPLGLKKTLLMEIQFSSNCLENFFSRCSIHSKLQCGTITILGSGDESISRPYKGTGGLFSLASGLELMHAHLTSVLVQFILVSTILMERQLSPGGFGGLAGGGLSGGGTEKREFEPERVYVCII